MRSRDPGSDKWMRQWVGAFAGAAVGWLLTTQFPELAQRFSVLTIVLWGAAIGALLTSLGWFLRAGAALTRRTNPWLNLAVGLGIPVLLVILIIYLLR
jgi:hypothetical protein